MNRLKKVVLGAASITALSLAMLGGVRANAIAVPPLTLNFVDQCFDFRTVDGGASEGLVSFDAVKLNGKGDNATLKWNANAKWDTYDVAKGDRRVDLSSKKPSKDLLVTIRDIEAKSTVVFWIPADTSKYKGKYESGKIVITDGKDTVKDVDLYNNAKFEYRTEFGNWNDYKPDFFKYAMYEQEGATLYFRRKALQGEGDGFTSQKDKLSVEDQSNVTGVSKAKSSYFASREFKVKIPKKANGPSIGIDYNWQTLKVKDTMEYRTIDWLDKQSEWTPVPSGVKTLKMSDIFEDGVTRGGIVEFRTKADPVKKQSASKATILKFPEAMHLLSTEFGLINKDGIQGMGELPDKGLIFNLLRKGGKNYCRFTNTNPDATYEIYSEDPFENNKAKKIAILKAPKDGEKTEVQVAEAKVPEKATLYVLVAADKKKMLFRSKAQPCGGPTVMYYPTEDTE